MKIYYEPDSISHHGIKGQKWGVRRFQNKDGTLTSKGKKRYKDTTEDVKKMSDNELRARIVRMRNEQKYIDLTKKESKISKTADKVAEKSSIGSKSIEAQKNISKLKGSDTSSLDIAGQGVKAVQKSASAIKKIDKMTSKKRIKKAEEMLKKMSDDDLKKVVDRLDLEKQFSEASKNSRNRGKVTVGEIMDVTGDVLTIAATITGIAVGIKQLRKL